MKHLVWLLMLVVGTVLAQVQPVTLPGTMDDACGCCGAECACALPAECAPPPPAPAPLPAAERPAILRAEVKRTAQEKEKFSAAVYFANFAPRATALVDRPAPTTAGLTAIAPLFTVHCSLRI
jgi:hypothetical protein